MRCFAFVALLLATSLAAEDVNKSEAVRTERQSDWFAPLYSNSWPFYDNYVNQDEVLQFRSLPRKNFGYGYNPNALQFTDDDVEARSGLRFLNNRNSLLSGSRPIVTLLNNFPVIRNPNFPTLQNVLNSFDSCTATTGESGVCTPAFACNAYGGRSSDSCSLGKVCCINVVNACDRQTTLNNTYWETPRTTITRPATCSITVQIDQRLIEQKTPICQVRLDFNSFTIAQPDSTTVCSTDAFRVTGASSTVPVICGDNAGQHMYIDVPNSAVTPTNLKLVFSFGPAGTVTPAWNVKISLLPCGASYLAPSNCLQYFTSTFGTVQSFNYKDVGAAVPPAPAVRQLANQNYRICFKSENAKSLCLASCTTTNSAFSLSGTGGTLAATANANTCTPDYLVFAGGYKLGATGTVCDRFCGTVFTADATNAPSSVCSDIKPFALVYVTDGTEPTTGTTDTNNVGFCFNYVANV